MKLRNLLIIAIFSFCYSLNAQQVVDSKFGKGIFNVIAKDSTWSMKFATRIQLLSTSTLAANDPNSAAIEQNFLVRRARFKFNGFAFSPKLKYKFELGLTNRDISGGSAFTRDSPRYILDAVVMWNFAPNWELWAGQTKLPGNIERVISSGNLQFVDRSILNSRFNIDRDVGLQLRHKDKIGENFVIREKIAVSQGEGRNVTEGNEGGNQFTGRVELLPFGEFTSKGDYSSSDLKREQSPKLMVSATYDHNNNAVRSRSNLGSYLFIDGTDDSNPSLFETNINTVFVDAIFKYKGYSFQGEFANRDAEEVFALNSDGTATGDNVNVGNSVNFQAGYLLPSNLEFSGRYSNISLDDIIGGLSTDQYTIGASKFFAGHKLKLQTDLTYETLNGTGNDWIYRLQLDVHF